MAFRLKARQVLALTGICVLMTYQNCAQAPDGASSAASYEEGLPFAFQERVDTIAHMSCSEIKDPVEPRAYFTFRVGAYSNMTGGLTMTPAFREATRFYSTGDRAKMFSYSNANAGMNLNLSIRARSNLQSPWGAGQSELRAGYEIEAFLPGLDAPEVAGPLAGAQPGYMMNYFPGTNSKRLIEASLRYYEFENVVAETRQTLEGAGTPAYLVVGYGDSSSETDSRLRSPSTLPQRAYGTAYALNFSLPRNYTAGERRVLAPSVGGTSGGVQEINLQTGQQVNANWDCSQDYQFMIIRPQDLVQQPGGPPPVGCSTKPDITFNATQLAALNAIRRVLRVEDWFVDVVNRCIVPKRQPLDKCYGNIGTRQVQYGVASCSFSNTTSCPHFVSICIRR